MKITILKYFIFFIKKIATFSICKDAKNFQNAEKAMKLTSIFWIIEKFNFPEIKRSFI